MSYSYENATKHTAEECAAAVGRRAVLPLTGRVVDSGVSHTGPYVKFEVDEHWGFRAGLRFVVDLDALTPDV